MWCEGVDRLNQMACFSVAPLPRCCAGRLLVFSSGEENPHRVGVRFGLSHSPHGLSSSRMCASDSEIWLRLFLCSVSRCPRWGG